MQSKVISTTTQTRRTVAALARLAMDMQVRPGVYSADVDIVIANLVKVTNISGQESAEHVRTANNAIARLRPQYSTERSKRLLMLATK